MGNDRRILCAFLWPNSTENSKERQIEVKPLSGSAQKSAAAVGGYFVSVGAGPVHSASVRFQPPPSAL